MLAANNVRRSLPLRFSVYVRYRQQNSAGPRSFDLNEDAIICRVTSVPRNGPLDVTITGWESAGLLKPSIARLDRIVTAEKKIFLRRLGTLSANDAEAVRSAWNQAMKL